MSKIISISLNQNILTRSEQFVDRRKRVISDILGENSFKIQEIAGDYELYLSIVENKLVINVNNHADFIFPLNRLRQIVKDYQIVCDSYFEAVKTSDTRKIEAIDMGRRGLHNEGAQIFQDYLEDKIIMDFETARKIFSLIYLIRTK